MSQVVNKTCLIIIQQTYVCLMTLQYYNKPWVCFCANSSQNLQYRLNATSLSLTLFHEWWVDSCDVRDARNPLLLTSTRDSKFASDFLSRAQILVQSIRQKAMTRVWDLRVWTLETQPTRDLQDIEAVSWHLCSTEKMPLLNVATHKRIII